MKHLKLFYLFLFIFLTTSTNFLSACKTFNTIYGSVTIEEPVLIELINSDAMQRLHSIHQYGISHYVKGELLYKSGIQEEYTRFEHSIGVLAILRRHGLSLNEQIAGLLHDVSHTAFSHLGDFLFKRQNKDQAFQDNILIWFIEEYGIAEILNSYNISIEEILPNGNLPLSVKQNNNNLCADNLEYTLKGSLLAGILTQKDICIILNDLNFAHEKQIWYFKDPIIAQKFANASLTLTRLNSGAIWNIITYKYAAKMLRRALKLNLISYEDLIFNLGDDIIWKKLCQSKDEEILRIIRNITSDKEIYTIVNDPEEHMDVEQDFAEIDIIHLLPKFRGINPYVLLNNGKIRNLSFIRYQFRQDFIQAKALLEIGWQVYFPNPNTSIIGRSETPIVVGC